MTSMQLAVLMRIIDNPGINATEVARELKRVLRDQKDGGSYVSHVATSLAEMGNIRRDIVKVAAPNTPWHYEVKPMYVTAEGIVRFRQHIEDITGVEIVNL